MLDEPAVPDEVKRLGPRAFKTWVQDPPQPWLGAHATAASACNGPRTSCGSGNFAATGGGYASGGAAADSTEGERGVDAMVDNLKQRFKQSGVVLPLEKHSGCVYRLGARKLSLNIRNSRLMVRVGGGYCDFLEYLSKAAL